MLGKKQKAFTLIELLVVISIIGLLASIVLVALNGARQKSRDTTRLANVKQIASAMEAFYNDASGYPTGAAYIGSAALFGGPNGQLMAKTYNFTPTYLGTIPSAPTPQDGACASTGSGGNQFFFQTTNAGDTYTLSFCLGYATGGFSAGAHNLTPAGIR